MARFTVKQWHITHQRKLWNNEVYDINYIELENCTPLWRPPCKRIEIVQVILVERLSHFKNLILAVWRCCGSSYRARVRCAWAKFKELSPILTVRGASYRVKGRIYSACVQSVLIYGTETWAMKADDLKSLERTEHMMVRSLVVEGARGRGRSKKAWEQCVRDDMKLLGLHSEWAVFRDMWRDLIWGKRLTLA